MANFEKIVQWVLYQEDSHKNPGIIINEGDGAGLTRLGVTQKYHGLHVPPEFFTTMPFHLAVEWAKTIYSKFFWIPIHGFEIEYDIVAAPLLSFAVNDNPRPAIKTLQEVLEVEPDGVIGPHTLAMLNQKDPDITARLFRAAWVDFYHREVNLNPSKAEFLDGWIARANMPYPLPEMPTIYA